MEGQIMTRGRAAFEESIYTTTTPKTKKLGNHSIKITDDHETELPEECRLYNSVHSLNNAKQIGNYTCQVSNVEDKLEECALCNGMHSIDKCDQFVNMAFADKQQTVRATRICYNCLTKGHISRECDELGCSIKGCASKHHHLLHPRTFANGRNSGKQGHVPQIPIPAYFVSLLEDVNDEKLCKQAKQCWKSESNDLYEETNGTANDTQAAQVEDDQTYEREAPDDESAPMHVDPDNNGIATQANDNSRNEDFILKYEHNDDSDDSVTDDHCLCSNSVNTRDILLSTGKVLQAYRDHTNQSLNSIMSALLIIMLFSIIWIGFGHDPRMQRDRNVRKRPRSTDRIEREIKIDQEERKEKRIGNRKQKRMSKRWETGIRKGVGTIIETDEGYAVK